MLNLYSIFTLLTLLCYIPASCSNYSPLVVQEAIELETNWMHQLHPAEHDELAELYVLRGESYLLNDEYTRAVEDFKQAKLHAELSYNRDKAQTVSFRVALGEAISYDNLGLQEQTECAIHTLEVMSLQFGCDHCNHHQPCHGNTRDTANGHIVEMDPIQPDTYSDIIGPDQEPEVGWCEMTVSGTARCMEVICLKAPSFAVRAALAGVIEALRVKAVDCCRAGGFWKACVAPIARKYKEWDDYRREHILPNQYTYPRFL